MGQRDYSFQSLGAINRAGGIIGINDKKSDNFGMGFKLAFQMRQVGLPIIFGIQIVNNRRPARGKGFKRRMGRIGRRRLDDARARFKHLVKNGNGRSQTAGKNDIFTA